MGDFSMISQHLGRISFLPEIDIPSLSSCDLFSFHGKPDFFRGMIIKVYITSKSYGEEMDLIMNFLPCMLSWS